VRPGQALMRRMAGSLGSAARPMSPFPVPVREDEDGQGGRGVYWRDPAGARRQRGAGSVSGSEKKPEVYESPRLI